MALTKPKKEEVVAQVTELLGSSKMTVIAKYAGTPVKAMQTLRRDAKQSGTTVKVIKNRLVKQALNKSDKFKDIDQGPLEGMLLYAFNSEDEVAPAQNLNNFARQNPNLIFVGALNADGDWLVAERVKELAVLPSKAELIGSLLNNLNSPLINLTNSLGGNLSGMIQALAARTD